ncbi:MAG: AMP-binding protein [Acidobacteriota bacterium]
MNVGQLSLDNLERFGEYTSLYFGEREISNKERLEAAAALASVLEERGVGVDDKVVVMMPNSPEVTAAFQAAWKLGAVIVPVTPQLGVPEVSYMLEDSGAKTLITSPLLAPLVCEAASGKSCEVLVLGASEAPGATDISAELEAAAGALPIDHLTPRSADDLALLLYTSGTTGQPKGVMLTHGNLSSNAHSVVQMATDTEPMERSLAVLPLSHSYGVIVMNAGYLLGGVTVLMPFFKLDEVFENLQKFQIQQFSVVPTMLNYMLNFPERHKYDLSDLKKVGSGGAALPNEIRLAFEKEFDCEVKEGYGMSECAPSATGYLPDEAYRPGSVGRAIPGVSISIRDGQNQELPAHTTGEICIQGPNVMHGYWNKEEATREALEGGWLHSGDVGHMDEDGFVFITDRKKDLIIKGAENISPREIEEAIYHHPGVAEVAVIGLPDETYGETVAAAVHLREGAEATEDDIRAQAAEFVTKFKVPTHVFFTGDLPKSGNGKILKRELREQFTKS